MTGRRVPKTGDRVIVHGSLNGLPVPAAVTGVDATGAITRIRMTGSWQAVPVSEVAVELPPWWPEGWGADPDAVVLFDPAPGGDDEPR